MFGYNQPPIIRVEPDPHVSLLTENLTSRQRNLSTQFQNLICYQMLCLYLVVETNFKVGV